MTIKEQRFFVREILVWCQDIFKPESRICFLSLISVVKM